MVFERNICGMEIALRIDGYEPPETHEYGSVWCDCGFSVRFGNVVVYRVDSDELFMPEEVAWLAKALTDLLEGSLEQPETLELMEPDFVFCLYPASGPEDIRAQWQVHFWCEGLTPHYLTIGLDRPDIEALRDFLNACREI